LHHPETIMPTPLPLSPFVNPDLPRFKLDAGRFMAELADELARWTLGPSPKFLADPSPEYLEAAQIVPVLEVLAGY
jgi:hypothetical protein